MKPLELIRRPNGIQMVFDAWPSCFNVNRFLWMKISTRTKLKIAGIYPNMMTPLHYLDIAYGLSIMKILPKIEQNVLRQLIRSLLLCDKYILLKSLLQSDRCYHTLAYLMFAVCLELNGMPSHITYKFIHSISNSMCVILSCCAKSELYGTPVYKWLMAQITGDRLLTMSCHFEITDSGLEVTGRFAKLNMQWYTRAISMPVVWSRISSIGYQNTVRRVTNFMRIPGFIQWCFLQHPSWLWFVMLSCDVFWKVGGWMMIYNLAVATLDDEYLQKSFVECVHAYPVLIFRLINTDISWERAELVRQSDVEYLKNLMLRLYRERVVGM